MIRCFYHKAETVSFLSSVITAIKTSVFFLISRILMNRENCQSFCQITAVRFHILLQATAKSHTNDNFLLRIRSQASEIKNEFIVTIRYVCYANSSAVDEKKEGKNSLDFGFIMGLLSERS
jgi:hypothetical protein